MNEREIYNPAGDEEGLPLNIPPAEAWNDMRMRLDSEIPAAGMPVPGGIIYADNDAIRPLVSLFILIIISSFLWWFNAGGTDNSKAVSSRNGQPVGAGLVLTVTKANNNSPGQITKDTATSGQRRTQAMPRPVNGLAVRRLHSAKKASAANIVVRNVVGAPADDIGNGNMATNAPIENYVGKIIADTGTSTPRQPLSNTKSTVKKDSIIEGIAQSEKDKLISQAGLLWKAQVPISGRQNYFAGPSAAPQPYRLLLPGGWISVQSGRYLLLAEVDAFETTVFNPKPFSERTTQVSAQSNLTETKKLNKLFGISAALRLDYNVAGNWWAGGGLQANDWQKGVITNYNALESNGRSTYYNTSARLSDSDWAYFSKLQVRTDAELMYKASTWHAGLRLGIFFTPVSLNYGGPSNPLQVDLFFRWKILNVNNPKKAQAQ